MAPSEFGEGNRGGTHDFGIVGHIIKDGALGRDLDAMTDL